MNILIIDDHEIVSDGIIKRLKKVLPNASCYYASNIRLAYALMHQVDVELVICDLEFENEPDKDGFYIVEKILSLEPRIKIIALTHYNSYRIMRKAKSFGFNSFLNKGCSFQDFSDAINGVLQHGNYQSKTEERLIKKRKMISKNIFSESLQGIYDLSKRELELTILSSKTTDRQELAEIMAINPFTVDSHFKNILSKLSLSNRKELAIFAMDFNDELQKLK